MGGRGDMKKEIGMMCKKMAENDKLYMQCMKKMNALAMGCKRRVGDDMEMIKECMMKAMGKEGEGKEGEGEGKEPEKVEDTCRTQKKNKMKKCYEEMCAKDAFMKSNKAACDKMAGRRRMEGETKMKCVGDDEKMMEQCIMKLMNMKDGGKGSGSGSGSGGRGDMKKEIGMMCKKMAENDKLY